MNISAVGLSTSSMAYTCASGKAHQNPNPFTIEEFVCFAHEIGLGGVEVPLQRFIPLSNHERLNSLKELLQNKGLYLVTDSDRSCDAEQIEALLPIARHFGSNVLRIKTSSVLGCNRKQLGEPWTEHVKRIIATLEKLAPIIEANGIKIAIENHQDLDSNDLVQIIESVGNNVVGVNFDIGNAFATCEDPIIFAKRFGSSILNIHIKDYKIYKSNEGYRLVRCPLGDGAVDFKPLFEYFNCNCPKAKMVIELGALEARNVKNKEPEFWDHIQQRDSLEKEAFHDILQSHQIHDNNWLTPWEKGKQPEEIVGYEINQLKKSVEFLKGI